MRNRDHVARRRRAKLAKFLLSGAVELRVAGNERSGFQLGGVLGDNFVTFSQRFNRQKDAVANGQRGFGQSAKKLLKKAVA